MTALKLAQLTTEEKTSLWFRNPAYFVGPEHYCTGGPAGAPAGMDGGAIKLDGAMVDPASDPNASAPSEGEIKELPEYEWTAGDDAPRNITCRVPWLRFRATGTNPNIPVRAY